MRSLKFKIQPTVMIFTADRKQKRLAQWGQKVNFLCSDWQISIHFVSFCTYLCGQSVVLVIMIDSSKTRNSLVGVKVQSPHGLVISKKEVNSCKGFLLTAIFLLNDFIAAILSMTVCVFPKNCIYRGFTVRFQADELLLFFKNHINFCG